MFFPILIMITLLSSWKVLWHSCSWFDSISSGITLSPNFIIPSFMDICVSIMCACSLAIVLVGCCLVCVMLYLVIFLLALA